MTIKNNSNVEFIYYLLDTLEKILLRKSCGSTFLELSKKELKKINIIIPIIEEQEKIANFLSAIDKKIELMEKKHTLYQSIKKYLLKNLFPKPMEAVPRLRFFEFKDNWDELKITDIFKERKERKFENLELLSVTINKGVIKRSDLENKDNSNKNRSKYKHVLPNDIVYNSMRMWQGASGFSNFEGIVSPAYTILIPKKNIISEFYSYYFKNEYMVNEFRKYSQGLTSDTWNLKYPLIAKIKLYKPNIKEQKKINGILKLYDIHIFNLNNKIKEIKKYKKGLLQKMFV